MESVKSADRAIELLIFVAAHPQGVKFSDICTQLGWPKSSTLALLNTLVGRRFLALDGDQRLYTIGIAAWEVGVQYWVRRDLAVDAQRYLQQLSEALNETVQLAILDGSEVVYIAKVDSQQPLALVSRVGVRLPAHVTAIGKVLLSALPAGSLADLYADADWPRFTERTLTSLPELQAELREAAARGYATDSGEYTRGIYCVAVPVRGRSGETIAGLSVSVPEIRVDDDLDQRMLDGLRQTSARIEDMLGAVTSG